MFLDYYLERSLCGTDTVVRNVSFRFSKCERKIYKIPVNLFKDNKSERGNQIRVTWPIGMLASKENF